MVQTGFANADLPACIKNTFFAFAEWIGKNDPTNYHSQCFPAITVNGVSSMYNETNNAASPYWCNGVNGNGCLLGPIYETTIGMTNATYVAAYGETTNPASVMGTKAPGWAHIRQVSYKGQRNGANNNPIRYANTTVYSGVCTPLPATGTCPYNVEGFDEITNGTAFLTVRAQTK